MPDSTPYVAFHDCDAFRRIISILLLMVLGSTVGRGQAEETIGNQFITAKVATDQQSGKFWITAGPAYGSVKFLYQSGAQITSHVVFQVKRSNATVYYCNVPIPWVNVRPRVAGQEIQFKPYDRLEKGADTLAVYWTGLSGFNITMRFIPEKPRSIYDNGSDMILEFEYENVGFGNPELGILLMLDGVNGEAVSNSGSGTGDKSSIITDQGYFPVSTFSRKFSGPPSDIIPEFYHIGNFRYELPLNTVYPLHKLKGTTHYGLPLTPPTLFAVGDWKQFWDIGWDFPPDLGSRNFEDCATLMRWEGMMAKGKVRTSFGMNNKGANDMYTCRDDSLFADIRTKRLITQAVKNGPYNVETFQVEMWLSNLNVQYDITPTIRLADPIASVPGATQRLTLDPSTPASQSLTLKARGTGKLTWLVHVNKNSADTMARLVFYHKMSQKSLEKLFKDGCNPLVTVIGYQDPPPNPPPDTVAPVIERTGVGRNQTAYWNFRTYDRHYFFKYDSGLDRVQVVANDGNNFLLTQQPSPFKRCDTTVDVNLTVEVVDTSQAARIVFAVYDCRGNITYDSAIYRPRPDVFKPTLDSIVATPFTRPSCNARVYEVYLADSLNQESERGDHGFGSIEALSLVNFDPIEINFDRGGTPIQPFDRHASFRARVTDRMIDGRAVIRIVDFAGNADTMTLDYCTIPDTVAPVGSVSDLGANRSWRLAASDSTEWDRGLAEIVVLSNLNNNVLYNGVDPATQPWTVIPGTPYITDLGGVFAVADDKKDAELILEIRDTRFKDLPAGHADTVRMTFYGTPDTLAPNFLNAAFAVDAGSTGVVATVEVNDIHYVNNNELYKYDLGLATIAADPARTSANIRVRPAAPIAFSRGDMRTTFQIEVLDTLANTIRDSICFEATDIAGNRSTRCYYYPLVSDNLSPIFLGAMGPDRSSISGIATDNRLYDRGLGSITLENPVNLDPTFALTNLNGAASTPVSITVLDPTKPVAGTLVITDFIGERLGWPEAGTVHWRRLPFYLPTSGVRVILPPLVEGRSDFDVPIIATDSFPGSTVTGISFQADYDGSIEYRSARAATAGATVVESPTGRLTVDMKTVATTRYSVGDTLAVLTFFARPSDNAIQYHFRIIPGTEQLNSGVGTIVTDAAPGDTGASTLVLPPMFVRLNSDSLGYTNGDCGRVLTTLGSSKRVGLAILGVSPQPVGAAAAGVLEVRLRDVPADGVRAELVAPDGHVVAVSDLSGFPSDRVVQASLTLPATLASGVYFIRVTGSNGVDWAKIIVSE